MYSETLLQRLNKCSETDRQEYLTTFPQLILSAAREGDKSRLEKYLGGSFGFVEAILMLGESQEGISSVEHLNSIYEEAIEIGCSNTVRLVSAALKNATVILDKYPDQLASHLYERLKHYYDGQNLADSIRPSNDYWLKPLRRKLFDANTSNIVAKHNLSAYQVFLTPDLRKLISVGHDHKIRVTQPDDNGASIVLVDKDIGQRKKEKDGTPVVISHDWSIVGATATPDSQQLYSLSMDGLLTLWDLNTYQKLDSFDLKQAGAAFEEASQLVFSNDGRLFYVADNKGNIIEFETRSFRFTGNFLKGFDIDYEFMNGLGETPTQLIHAVDRSMLVVIDNKSRIRIWYPQRHEIRTIDCGVILKRIELTLDSAYLYGRSGTEVLLIDMQTGQELDFFRYEGAGAAYAPFSYEPKNKLLYIADEGTLTVLNTQTREEIYKQRLHGPVEIHALNIYKQGKVVVTGDDIGNVRLTNVTNYSDNNADRKNLHDPFVEGVVIDQDGTHGISIGFDKQILWSLNSSVRPLSSYTPSISLNMINLANKFRDSAEMSEGIVFRLAYTSEDQGTQLIPCLMTPHDNQILQTFHPSNDYEIITCFNVHPKFQCFAYTTQVFVGRQRATKLYIYQLFTSGGTSKFEFAGSCLIPYEVTKLAFVLDALEILIVGEPHFPEEHKGKVLDLYDLDKCSVIHRFHKSLTGLKHMLGTTNMDKVIASDSSTVYVWDVDSKQLLYSIEAEESISSVQISANDKIIAIATLQNSLGIWSLETGKKLTAYQNNEYFKSVSVSCNGSRIMTGDVAGYVNAFELVAS